MRRPIPGRSHPVRAKRSTIRPGVVRASHTGPSRPLFLRNVRFFGVFCPVRRTLRRKSQRLVMIDVAHGASGASCPRRTAAMGGVHPRRPGAAAPARRAGTGVPVRAERAASRSGGVRAAGVAGSGTSGAKAASRSGGVRAAVTAVSGGSGSRAASGQAACGPWSRLCPGRAEQQHPVRWRAGRGRRRTRYGGRKKHARAGRHRRIQAQAPASQRPRPGRRPRPGSPPPPRIAPPRIAAPQTITADPGAAIPPARPPPEPPPHPPAKPAAPP